MGGVNIRVADKRDLQGMTQLHEASFSEDEHIGALLGRAYIRAYYEWHMRDPRAYVLIAELDGKLVGLLGMCDVAFTKPMLRGTFRALLRSLLLHPGLLFDRRLWARFERSEPAVGWAKRFGQEAGVSQMTIGVVDADARGHSIFPKLIFECEAVSRARGAHAVRAGVYEWNKSCQRAFEKQGWMAVPELRSHETVVFVKVFSPSIIERFPQLGADGSGRQCRPGDFDR